MAYLYLIIAIIAEIFATTIMKDTNGFTVLWPSVFTILGYVVAFICLVCVYKQFQPALYMHCGQVLA